MNANKTTEKVRAELNNGYCYVRNLEEKGGVIDAMINESILQYAYKTPRKNIFVED